mgnify:CR=1 FL=1
MIGIIDYNMGNLASVYNACHLLDAKATIVKDPNDYMLEFKSLKESESVFSNN